MREILILTSILTVLFFFVLSLIIAFRCRNHKWYWVKSDSQFGFPSENKWAKEKGMSFPDFLPVKTSIYKCKCGTTKKAYSQFFTHFGIQPKEIIIS